MTANLQDDPAIAPRFIEKWEQGYEMVYEWLQQSWEIINQKN